MLLFANLVFNWFIKFVRSSYLWLLSTELSLFVLILEQYTLLIRCLSSCELLSESKVLFAHKRPIASILLWAKRILWHCIWSPCLHWDRSRKASKWATSRTTTTGSRVDFASDARVLLLQLAGNERRWCFHLGWFQCWAVCSFDVVLVFEACQEVAHELLNILALYVLLQVFDRVYTGSLLLICLDSVPDRILVLFAQNR